MRALPLLVLVLPACGASYQTRYEADIHFARCYRMDAEPAAQPPERLACWSQWRAAYSQTEARDRAAHAEHRVAQLERGDAAMVGPVVPMAKPVKPVETAVAGRVAPQPPGSGSAMAFAGGDPPGLNSSQLCARDCGVTFTSCVTACNGAECAQRCGNGAKVCIGNCL